MFVIRIGWRQGQFCKLLIYSIFLSYLYRLVVGSSYENNLLQSVSGYCREQLCYWWCTRPIVIRKGSYCGDFRFCSGYLWNHCWYYSVELLYFPHCSTIIFNWTIGHLLVVGEWKIARIRSRDRLVIERSSTHKHLLVTKNELKLILEKLKSQRIISSLVTNKLWFWKALDSE